MTTRGTARPRTSPRSASSTTSTCSRRRASSRRRTMEELAAAAEALTTDGVVGLSFGRRTSTAPGVFMLANGGYIVNDDVSEMTLDTEENRAALQYLADMFAAGHAAAPPTSRPTGRRGLRSGQRGDGHRGQLDRRRDGPGLPRRQLGESPSCRRVRPVGRRMPSRCATASPPSRRTRKPSWEAIDFLTGPEGAAAWTAEFNVMPARESLREGWLADHPELEPFLNGAEYAHRWQFRPASPTSRPSSTRSSNSSSPVTPTSTG